MPPELALIVANLLRYSMEPIEWKFADLTEEEKIIVGSQANLDLVRKFAEENPA